MFGNFSKRETGFRLDFKRAQEAEMRLIQHCYNDVDIVAGVASVPCAFCKF